MLGCFWQADQRSLQRSEVAKVQRDPDIVLQRAADAGDLAAVVVCDREDLLDP